MGYWRSFNDDANSMLVRLKNMLLPNYAPHGTPEAPILSLDIRRSPWLYSGHTFEETQNLHAEHKSHQRREFRESTIACSSWLLEEWMGSDNTLRWLGNHH